MTCWRQLLALDRKDCKGFWAEHRALNRSYFASKTRVQLVGSCSWRLGAHTS